MGYVVIICPSTDCMILSAIPPTLDGVKINYRDERRLLEVSHFRSDRGDDKISAQIDDIQYC